MKETPIFRNIQHVPRIWGVTYPKAFGSLGVGLLFTTVAFASAGRASATRKIGVLVIGIFVTAASTLSPCGSTASTRLTSTRQPFCVRTSIRSQCRFSV